MNKNIFRIIFLFICITTSISALSQGISDSVRTTKTIIDSLKKSGVILNDSHKKPEIMLTTNQAVSFLRQRLQPQYWHNTSDSFRKALGQLIFEASHPPFDSAEYFLKLYPYDSLSIPWDKFYIWEPLRLKIPDQTAALLDIAADSANKADTNVVKGINDSLTLNPGLLPKPVTAFNPVNVLKDTTIMVIIDTLDEVTSSHSGFPFRYLNFPYQGDSIQVAVKSLLNYLEERDSVIVNFTGIGNEVTPVWMNSKSEKMMRYWLRNEFSDSVTIWIGNPSRDTIGLYLEKGVTFRRPGKQANYSEAKVNVKSLDNSKLLDVQRIIVKQQFWKYRTEAAFVLNQSSMTNWVKGGESNLSTAVDITTYADYKNASLKLSSNNFARFKFGYIKSGENGIRKNLDLLETNSKLNHKAFGKFDFSGIMLFKTQLAPGYNYPNDSVQVSKFINPAILTIGLGLDYKPNKNTSINFSPLSYKGTFVPDTANIDQTKYGIAKNKKSLNEPGLSFMITNEYKPSKSVTVINRLQLFTNYINNPQNIDIDWEMIVVANLNWFTDVRFNTHLIFDDDTKTVVLDDNKKPVMENGVQKKTARIQFKEMLGFSLVFRF